MSDFIEICPQCGKVFFLPCKECCYCGSSFDLADFNARRQKWIKSNDIYLSIAMKQVRTGNFFQPDRNLAWAVLRSGDFEALKKIVKAGYEQWEIPDLIAAAMETPFPEITAFMEAQGINFKQFQVELSAGLHKGIFESSSYFCNFNDQVAGAQRLFLAVDSDDLELAEKCLKNGVDPNFRPQTVWRHSLRGKYRTSVHEEQPVIVRVKSVEMAELLLKHGAVVDDPQLLKYMTFYNDCTDSSVIRCLVEHGAAYSLNDPDLNLLARAAEGGNLDLVKYIHSLGFDVNSVDCKNKTPLCNAAEWNRTEIVEYLLENGAKVFQKTKDN